MYKSKKLLFYFLILLIMCAGFSYYVVIYVAPYSIIKPHHYYNQLLNNYLNNNYHRFEFLTKDNVRIVGYLIKPENIVSRRTIIIIHGIGSSKESQIGIAEYLSDNGFNSIIFDLRAQGESGGSYCTYGYYEKFDISEIINMAITNISDSSYVGIMGTSLGGAIAIQSMSLDKRIKCGILISTFASLEDIVYQYMNKQFYIPFRFITDAALNEAGKIADFPVKKINPKDFAKNIVQPTLIIHGTSDERINIENGKEIYNNLKTKNKFFYEVTDAMHNDVAQVGGLKYKTEILNFFNRYLK